VRLAVVVQRYAADIGGGSELHARYIAEHLAAHADVRVLTTCARDYVSWRNEYPAGETRVNGIAVERFPVAHERDPRVFARVSSLVFDETHSVADELHWLEQQGPVSPPLIERVRASHEEFDFVLLFSLRYHCAFHGAYAAGRKAVLVPTTERDPALGLAILGPVFRGARGIMYNSPEERALITSLHGNAAVPGVTVGVGSDVPDTTNPERAAAAFGLERPYVLYVGRIDVNKGCGELFDYFLRYTNRSERPLDLVLIGTPVMPIPEHPRIRHLGYVSDADKYDVLAGAEALVMPSYFESLSMVMLEAWAIGVPVLANGRCDVLAGQCLRSNAGLYYESGREFEAMLDTLLDDPALAEDLGHNGRVFYEAHYRWPVIERTYLDMFDRLEREPAPPPMAPLPGWLVARRKSAPAGSVVVDAAPKGPVRESAGGGPEGTRAGRELS
jgi:glycosyltransferase involved in cell wall biosynthesis